MKTFIENVDTISRHNTLFDKRNVTYRMGINQFADMTFKEFSEANKVKVVTPDNVPFHPETFKTDYNVDIPTSFDWREFGAVDKLKDQEKCGSCYAMATLDSLESQIFIKTGKSVTLSVQEVIDCAGEYETWGCEGGINFRVLDYVKDNGGISSADSYSYKGIHGKCARSEYPKIPLALKGFGEVETNDEELLKHAVVKVGPIIVSIDIDHESFMRYSTGVYNDPDCSRKSNHAVLLVGYGNENNQDYWLIKNSFGETWGEFGYMRLARNSDSHCGIAGEPIYPLVN